MKRILSLLMILCLCTVARAQVKAGDVISGTVSDDVEGLMMVNVVEKDANNRIVAHGTTDMNGHFSFRINNPKNKLTISYVGYETQVLPIDRKVYNIKMKEKGQIQEVVIKAVRKSQSSGLQIPVTEISVAQQSISMKEFEGLAMTSVDEALQGRISGLDIVANSGNLGAGTTMRLRGVSTINGNADPLIVVNGNVWTNDANANFDYTNANEEKFAELLNVNPEDIELITVLKDAAATAIWGSQGANGVIEIKTKRGQRGKTQVQYSYRLTGNWQPEGYKLLNGDDYTMYLKEGFFNTALNSAFGTKGNSNYIPEINYDRDFSEFNMYNDNTDWRKAVKQTGWQHQHFVSLMGGGEKANFRVSGGYDNQTNSIIKQHLDRFTTRVALDYFVSDRIKVSTNFNVAYTKNKKNYRYNGNDLLAIALNKMPNLSIYEEDENGNDLDRYYTMNRYITTPVAAQATHLGGQYDLPNPVAIAHHAKDNEKTIQLSPEFLLKYEILGTHDDQHRLTYDGQVVFDIYNNDNFSFFPGTLLSSNWSSNTYNSSSNSSYKSNSISTRHSLTFKPHFKAEGHSLLVLLQGRFNSGNSTSQNQGTKWLPTSSITNTLAGGALESLSTGAGEWKGADFILQTHYSYKGKYSITASLRHEGSTKFGKDKRWGNFGGISARWNISDEKFLEKAKWLDMLSIHPSWGVNGRAPGSEGTFYSKYSTGGNYMNEGTMYPNNIRLSDLKWEETEEYNLGFDFGFFNKISGDLSIYHKKTHDLLMANRSIPSSSGFTSLSWQNVGEMKNNGWEFNINGHDVIKTKKFGMDFNITFANNRNEITKMDPTVIESLNAEFDYKNGSYLSRVQVNNPLGSIYGFRYKGVYQYSDYSPEEIKGVSGPNAPVARNANGEVILNAIGNTKFMYFDYEGQRYKFVGGDAIYEDINHDGNINELDIVYLGSSLPKLTGGFGVKFRYDQFAVNIQFNYRYGNKAINYARMGLENMSSINNQSRAVNWRWHNEGDNFENMLPRAYMHYTLGGTNYTAYNYLGSDRYVEDASFIRLNYMQFSYNFNPKILKQWGMSSLRLNLTLNNLLIITKYSGADPEIVQAGYAPAGDNSRTPRSKSFTLGATVAF